MANQLLLAVIIGAVCCVSACPDKPSVLTRDATPRRSLAPLASGQCVTSGEVICSADCKSVILCNRDETTWTQIQVEACESGLYCDAKQRSCHSGLSTCSPTSPPVYRLHCAQTGFYPDPYDCTVYHECPIANLPSEIHSCDPGWAYDPLTARCDLTYGHRVCTQGPIPACETAAASGPVPENPNIYYVCLKTLTGLLPELYRCMHNGQYNGVECIE